jgi:hypothetical protein
MEQTRSLELAISDWNTNWTCIMYAPGLSWAVIVGVSHQSSVFVAGNEAEGAFLPFLFPILAYRDIHNKEGTSGFRRPKYARYNGTTLVPCGMQDLRPWNLSHSTRSCGCLAPYLKCNAQNSLTE